jgi:hypothetical protein
LKDSNVSPKVKKMEEKGVGVRSFVRSTLGVEGHAKTLGCGLEQVISTSIIHTNLHKTNNKLVSAWLEHFLCMDKPRAYTDSQDSPWPGLGGSHHLFPYSILNAWPWGLHPNVILCQDSQVESPKILEIETHDFGRP